MKKREEALNRNIVIKEKKLYQEIDRKEAQLIQRENAVNTKEIALEALVEEKTKADVIVSFTTDPTLTEHTNPYVMNVIEKVTAHKLQTQALDEVAAGNVVRATRKLRAAATRLLELGEDELAQTARDEAERLEQGEGLSARGTKKLRYETRKLTQKLGDE